MASQQQLKRENKNDEQGKVPKMTTHYESLTVQDPAGDQPKLVHQVIDTVTLQNQQQHNQKGTSTQTMQKKEGSEEYKGPSLEDISKYRGTAQQHSIEAIRAAEDKYQKAKNETKSSGVNKVPEKSRQTEDYGLMDTAVDATNKGVSYVGEAADIGKNIALKTGKTVAQSVGKAAGVVKDVGLVAGWNAAELAGDAAAGVKGGVENVSGQTNEAVAGLIDTAADVSERGASYVGETAVAGKDITLEAGKTAGEYVSKAAGVLKDVATVAGWKAAEIVAGMTENVQDVSGQATDVAGEVIDTAVRVGEKGVSYVGDTAVAGKDITLETGKKAAGVLKDAAVVGGWNAAEFAGEVGSDVKEALKDVSGQATDVAGRVIDTALDVGKKGVRYVGHISLETGKTTAEYAGKGAGVLKDCKLMCFA